MATVCPDDAVTETRGVTPAGQDWTNARGPGAPNPNFFTFQFSSVSCQPSVIKLYYPAAFVKVYQALSL